MVQTKTPINDPGIDVIGRKRSRTRIETMLITPMIDNGLISIKCDDDADVSHINGIY